MRETQTRDLFGQRRGLLHDPGGIGGASRAPFGARLGVHLQVLVAAAYLDREDRVVDGGGIESIERIPELLRHESRGPGEGPILVRQLSDGVVGDQDLSIGVRGDRRDNSVRGDRLTNGWARHDERGRENCEGPAEP